jgi:DMSO/TMAO reductase YedYZ molybdopterin-dependent catalytic subunit
VTLGRVLERAAPLGSWLTVYAASGSYSSCLPLADAAHGFLAWARDGRQLTPEAGGPLRYLPPSGYWAYKGVKWATRVTVVDRFVPGFWEARVADPLGRIPTEVELP